MSLLSFFRRRPAKNAFQAPVEDAKFLGMREHFYLGQSLQGFHRLHYTEFGSPGTEPPVVCVHGMTQNGRDFDALAESLAAQGRHVFCPDILGRGQSDWATSPSAYNYPQYLSDLTALLARIDAPQVDWVGTSMGGLLGMFMAAQPKTPVRRLVMNDVGPELSRNVLKGIARYIERPVSCANVKALERIMREMYASFGTLTDDQWAHLAAHSARTLPDGRVTFAYDPAVGLGLGVVFFGVKFWPYYDRIRIPTLVLRGENSLVLSAKVADAMTKRGPKAQLVTVPGCGHAPALMDDEQINIIKDFLS